MGKAKVIGIRVLFEIYFRVILLSHYQFSIPSIIQARVFNSKKIENLIKKILR